MTTTYKGVAVSQIILLVLGILVLAVVAFLLYSNFVQTGTTISAETCRAEATRACTGCIIAEGIGTTSCDYDADDETLVSCFNNNNLLGASTPTSIDCTQYTGGGTSSNTNNIDNSDNLGSCVEFDSAGGETCDGTIDIRDGSVVCCTQ